jgi:hypothetical protein
LDFNVLDAEELLELGHLKVEDLYGLRERRRKGGRKG